MNISDEIKRLHELHQAGALTDAEFEAAKAKLLDASASMNQPGGSSNGGSNGRSGAQSDFTSDINKLRRARNDRWLGGVCGGLGRVTGLESWIWRLIFALSTTVAGIGLGIYILMWIFVPEE